MVHKKYILIAAETMIVFSLMLSSAFAQSGIEPQDVERVGLTGWQFLKINLDARQAAMGGAFTAISHGDVGSVFGNPAALADVENWNVAFNNVSYIADISYVSGVIAKNVEGIGVFAVSFASLDMGDIPETINSPIAGENRTTAVVTGRNFTGGDFAAGISYSRYFSDRLSIGGTIRWIREKIDDLSMDNVSIDIGTVFYTGFKSLRIAMAARNFGPDQNLAGWDEDVQIEPVDVRMPIEFRLGLGMDLFDYEGSPHLLTVVLEGTHPNDGPERVNFGTEYWFNQLIALRAGYRFNYDEEGLTLGAGAQYGTGEIAGRINYAYVDFGRLEQVHMFTIGLVF